MNITPAEGSSKDVATPTFYATDIQSLGVLVAESKRLKEAAGSYHTLSFSMTRFDDAALLFE